MVRLGFPNLTQKDPSFGKLHHVINPLTPRTFWQKCVFLHIMVVLRLDLLQNAFATRQLALLATTIPFNDIWLNQAQKLKIWEGDLSL